MTDQPTPETDAAELSVADYAVTLEEARGVITRLTRLVSELEGQRDDAREALQRIADCDWVITLPHRIDAFKKIAQEALSRHQVVTKTLPCPFCESDPVIVHRENTEGVDIRCLNPDCILHYGLDLWMGEPEMVKMWNRRTANKEITK